MLPNKFKFYKLIMGIVFHEKIQDIHWFLILNLSVQRIFLLIGAKCYASSFKNPISKKLTILFYFTTFTNLMKNLIL
jgi:hypothetical protein